MILNRIVWLSNLILLLTGCATTGVPDLIRNKPLEEIGVAQVQKNPQAYIGKQVRWGGAIIGVENFKEYTLVELLSRRLSAAGKPASEGPSKGRFMITVPGFIDPEEYPKERLMTVTGKISRVVEKRVGEYPYIYPMVEAEAYHLWPEELKERYPYHHRPFYSDPWYDPWYDPWHYPWYRHPYHW